MKNSDTRKKLQVLAWLAHDKIFGLRIDCCKEVEKNKKITPVPYARDYISGIVNSRGEIVTVINLERILGYDRCASTSQNVIVYLKDKAQKIAIKADKILDTVEIASEELEPPPANFNEKEHTFIDGVSMTSLGLLMVLDYSAILAIKNKRN